jgi:hypothetical protein
MVRQRGEGAEAVLMILLVSRPIQLTKRNNRHHRHSRASNPEREIEDSGLKPTMPLFSAAARPTEV